MLSEVLLTKVEEPKSDRVPELYCSGLFPCPYRLYLMEKGIAYSQDEPTARELWNMEDGWDQEEQSVARLKRRGIEVGDRQARVCVGESHVRGKIDGTVSINSENYLWEHKAWDKDRFSRFCYSKLEEYPAERAQINSYMLGRGLRKGIFMVKNKNNNDYHDEVVKYEPDFIKPILEWADMIRIKGWVPEPEKCEWCKYCFLNCFGQLIDFSKIAMLSVPEISEKWVQGKALKDLGESMIEEAREYILGKEDKYGTVLVKGIMGDREVLTLDGIEVKKVIVKRSDISKQKVLELFGPEGLIAVTEPKEIITYRIRSINE